MPRHRFHRFRVLSLNVLDAQAENHTVHGRLASGYYGPLPVELAEVLAAHQADCARCLASGAQVQRMLAPYVRAADAGPPDLAA